MNLKEVVSLCFIGLAFAISAQAADLPENPRPRPRPEEPSPDYPSQPPEAPRPERHHRCHEGCQTPAYIPRTIYLNTILTNTYLDLVQVMGLGMEYSGYQVVSVEVQVQGGVGGSQLSLYANGQMQGTFFNPFGLMTLAPQYPLVLNCSPSFLMLEVRGAISVGAITVNLRPSHYEDGRGDYDRDGYDRDDNGRDGYGRATPLP